MDFPITVPFLCAAAPYVKEDCQVLKFSSIYPEKQCLTYCYVRLVNINANVAAAADINTNCHIIVFHHKLEDWVAGVF